MCFVPHHIRSVQLVKYMAKLNGVPVFGGLWTGVNDLEQIRLQDWVPTKSLEHIEAGLCAMVTSRRLQGHPEPILLYTDNVNQDRATAIWCIPSLAHNTISISSTSTAGLSHLHHFPQPLPP